VQPTPDYQQADNPNVKNEDKADYGKIGNKSGKNFGPAILRDSPETDGPRENADGWKEVVFEFESVAYCEESGDFFEGIRGNFESRVPILTALSKLSAPTVPSHLKRSSARSKNLPM